MHRRAPLVIFEGIDGSGKSQTAHESASNMTSSYRDKQLRLIDGDGVYVYRNGEVVAREYIGIDRLKHRQTSSRLGSLALAGAFTLARRYLEHKSRASQDDDLTLAVRDPYRIDPAVYSGVFSPAILGRLGASTRLRLFDRFSPTGYYPEHIIYLRAESSVAESAIGERSFVDYHENAADLHILSEEFSQVLCDYSRLFDRTVSTIDAHTVATADSTTAVIEPFIDGAYIKRV